MSDKATWLPHPRTLPSASFPLPPRPGIARASKPLAVYTSCCPHCSGVHFTKGDFIACRTGTTGR